MIRNALVIAVLAVLAYGVFNYLNYMGVFRKFHKHYPGECKRIKNARLGSEDMVWTNDGLAFISSGISIPAIEEYLKVSNTNPSEILLFDFNNPSIGVTNLTIKASKGFDPQSMRPHGIDVLEDKVKGNHLLYVVNHPHEQIIETVEKFQFDPATRSLVHLKTIEMEGVNFGNDVAVVAEDQFYYSDYVRYKGNFPLTVLQNIYPLKTGGLFFYDGSRTLNLERDLATPNGIVLSKDKKFLYVLMFLEESVYVYERSSKTNSVRLVQKAKLGAKGDNPNLSPSGDALLIGAHPFWLNAVSHLLAPFDPQQKSPSSVIRVPLGKDGLVQENDITEVFYDHGDLISGSSSAAAFNGQMLVGSIANALVHCQVKQKV